MDEQIIQEIIKECKGHEKIVVKLFPRTFIKIYYIIRIKIMNYMLK